MRRFQSPCVQAEARRRLTGRWGAFTLVEMLVVMAIIVLILSMAGPAITALKGANDMSKAASDIASVIQVCRSYAVANNTYVYLGMGEFDASQPESATQAAASATRGGRVAMVAVASKDGTRGYTPFAAVISDVKNDWTSKYNKGANFSVIVKLQRYENLHLLDYGQAPPASGNMARPSLLSYYRFGSSDTNTVTPLTYPPGSTSPAYTFNKVIQFDPEGLLRIAPTGAPAGNPGSSTYFSPDGVPDWIEIAFIQTHGSAVPNVGSLFPSSASQNTGNHVCMQIDGMKGTVRTYRP